MKKLIIILLLGLVSCNIPHAYNVSIYRNGEYTLNYVCSDSLYPINTKIVIRDTYRHPPVIVNKCPKFNSNDTIIGAYHYIKGTITKTY
jgi:hypothetical protein